MVKAEKGTPKFISNRIKAKGLQKLKHYCQMCNKQCRDENGFKCHLTSDSHLRLMQLFRSNSKLMLNSFSKKFEHVFMDELKRRHGTKKTCANTVYQDVIRERHHVHMNATSWTTLTDFVIYLGKSGKCKVEETERGWYLSYLERDPVILKRRENYERKKNNERISEKRIIKNMQEKREGEIKLMKKKKVEINIVVAGNIKRGNEISSVKFKLKDEKKKKNKGQRIVPSTKSFFFGSHNSDDENRTEQIQKENIISYKKIFNKPGKNKIEKSLSKELIKNEMRSPIITMNDGNTRYSQHESMVKKKKDWIIHDILVRIVSKEISKGMYYQRKGIVQEVYIDKENDNSVLATVELIDSKPGKNDGGDVIEVYQNDLDTVIPMINKRIVIVDGREYGKIGNLIKIEKYGFGTIELNDGMILKHIPFRYFSKWVGY